MVHPLVLVIIGLSEDSALQVDCSNSTREKNKIWGEREKIGR